MRESLQNISKEPYELSQLPSLLCKLRQKKVWKRKDTQEYKILRFENAEIKKQSTY